MEKKDSIKIQGHTDTWSEIDSIILEGKAYYLMENDEWGDETEYLAIDDDNNVICDEIYDCWVDHLVDAINDQKEGE